MWLPLMDVLAALLLALGSVTRDSNERRLDYRLLARALERYRALAADSAVPSFATPASRVVRPGDTLATVSQLRARLVALGDFAAESSSDTRGRYLGPVVGAVRRFQQRHGFEDDGIIGPRTLDALQYPLALRVPQIEASLERIRREPAPERGPFITVNVPAFRLFAFDGSDSDSTPALDIKVIVGRASLTPTPELAEQLLYLDFWPYWNVPRSILVKEILPRFRRDREYLKREGMELVGEDGAVLGDSASRAVLRALATGVLRVRQRPGGSNPLGRVKFVIPNDSNVYLHDTPNKQLFANVRRDFSHGCIRLEHARDLALWALRDHLTWNADSVDAAMTGPGTRRVWLPRAVPVLVEYNSVLATADGRVWFLPDVYGREGEPGNMPRRAPPARSFDR